MTRWFGAAILCLALLAAGCGGPEDAELTVLAASSTRLALDDAVEAFERESGIDVAVSYAGSQTLAAQVAAGFPADIFISADVVHLERLRADDLVANWTSIASNSLAILVADDNPLGITGLDEVLLRDDLVIVAADPAVPLGAHTERLLVQLGHSLDGDDLRLASLEASAQAVAAKVLDGEADVGFGFLSDGGLDGLQALAIDGPELLYLIALVRDSDAGAQLVSYLQDADTEFAAAGFGPG
ncbi:MAG: molybdate ABC transporter substrate-binding protein [Acidimicrobiales bacterium]|jgi:molybdate transport system substrate-binding protein